MTSATGSPRFARILVKLSGEALLGAADYGIDPLVIKRIASELRDVQALGTQVAVVIGGGNIFRGAGLARAGMDRVTADQMGMLATVMNALAMQDALESLNVLCARDVGDPHQRSLRGLHPPPRSAAPGKGPHSDLRGRHRQPVFHHRHAPPRCVPSRSAPSCWSRRPRSTASTRPIRCKIPRRCTIRASPSSAC